MILSMLACACCGWCPLVPLRALIPEDRRVRFIRRACVGCRQTVQVLPTFRASSRRRATELSFRGAVMVFLVFLEVLEMSSEVVGPGPNTREIKSLRVDPGPRACALPPDAGCMLGGGFLISRSVGPRSQPWRARAPCLENKNSAPQARFRSQPPSKHAKVHAFWLPKQQCNQPQPPQPQQSS